MPSPITIDWSKIDNPELVFQRFSSRRSVVYGTKGIVASTQPLATEAADAAVATSAALNVTEPSCCGIGGSVVPNQITRQSHADPLHYRDQVMRSAYSMTRKPRKSALSMARDSLYQASLLREPTLAQQLKTCAGAAAAWVDTVSKFGSGQLSVADVLEPAIRLAEEGVPVSELHSHAWQRSEKLIKNASPNGDEMLLNGKAPLPGQVVKLPNLAQTFRDLAIKGKDGFYKGRVAQAIVDVIQSRGGVMELEDLAKHATDFVEPISYTYGDVTLALQTDKASLTALMALGVLESLQEQGISRPLSEMEHNSPEYLHTIIEALRLAFSDTEWYVTDPEVEHVPVAQLLSKAYLAERAKLFDPTKTNPKVIHGKPVNSSDTVYFSVTDQWGNACSYIQSNYAGFGTGAVPKGCGFTLQNRGCGFVLDENHPNALKGGKRPYHTIIPALVTRGDELFMSYGVMGGYMQPQGHVQVLLNVLRGFTVQAALDAPRFCISAGMPDPDTKSEAGDPNSEVYIEEGISAETVAKLREMGHNARVATGFMRGILGRGQVIQKVNDASGQLVWAAGSDQRGDGHAAAQI
ncbi:hypothetical protein DXG01_000231 [Tephrocybe rancida]|nr:hypothetical protein DXG01_000231 [Tephrocybe rancida]